MEKEGIENKGDVMEIDMKVSEEDAGDRINRTPHTHYFPQKICFAINKFLKL